MVSNSKKVRRFYKPKYPKYPMVKKKRKIMAKVSDDGKQKRLTIPKQKETESWEDKDWIELKKVGDK